MNSGISSFPQSLSGNPPRPLLDARWEIAGMTDLREHAGSWAACRRVFSSFIDSLLHGQDDEPFLHRISDT